MAAGALLCSACTSYSLSKISDNTIHTYMQTIHNDMHCFYVHILSTCRCTALPDHGLATSIAFTKHVSKDFRSLYLIPRETKMTRLLQTRACLHQILLYTIDGHSLLYGQSAANYSPGWGLDCREATSSRPGEPTVRAYGACPANNVTCAESLAGVRLGR